MLEDASQAEQINALRAALAAAQQAAVDAQRAAADAQHVAAVQQQTIAKLQHDLAWSDQRVEFLTRKLYGRRSEVVDAAQLGLGLSTVPRSAEDPSTGGDAVRLFGSESAGVASARSGGGRNAFPAHLPRRTLTADPPAEPACPCCQVDLQCIGTVHTERLDWIPGHAEVVEIVRGKWACPRCTDHGVLVADPPEPFALPKAGAANGMVAHLLTSKFADHMPLTRIQGIFERQGLSLPKSTLCRWTLAGAELFDGVVDAMRSELLAGSFIQADETPYLVLEGRRNQRVSGYVWVYANEQSAVFRYTPGRGAKYPAEFLDGFTGVLQTDGYAGYNFYRGAHAGCWAHARRKFFDAMNEHPAEAITALGYIRGIFTFERDARAAAMSPSEVAGARNEHTRPLVDGFRRWLEEHSHIRPKSMLGAAIGYALNQWDELITFLDYGFVPATNNASERNLRHLVIGRKNWLFSGGTRGARASALMFSIVQSCRLAQVDPLLYIDDVLPQLRDATPKQCAEFIPHRWMARRRDRVSDA